jgi:NAD(P)-dependent dehydrogenase (short-subunit alcohol dehydrogenase family)
MNAQLDGKVAIVTGAGRGIGRGVSLAFAREGARVGLLSRSAESLAAAQAEIEQLGGEARSVVCDVGDSTQVTNAVAHVLDRFGRIDVLVNNAQSWGPKDAPPALFPSVQPEEIPEEWWDHTFETGVKATFSCCRAVFPHMKEAGGRIINFGSGAGMMGMPTGADYAANKEAIRASTRSLARAWGKHGITVNVICPAALTDPLRLAIEARPSLRDELLAGRAIPRFADPEQDVGALAVFLAGDGAGYITGGTFMLDGGNFML